MTKVFALAPFVPGLILLAYGLPWAIGRGFQAGNIPGQIALASLFGLLAVLTFLSAGCDLARVGPRLLSWRSWPRLFWHLIVSFVALVFLYAIFVQFSWGFEPIDGGRIPEP